MVAIRSDVDGIHDSMGDFRKLRVWRSAHALMLNVHRAAQAIRGGEYLALRSQIIRAAASIPTNIVEGRARTGDREFRRFLSYSLASTRELEYHLLAARDMGALDQRTFASLSAQATDVRKMLHGLTAKLAERQGDEPSGRSERS